LEDAGYKQYKGVFGGYVWMVSSVPPLFTIHEQGCAAVVVFSLAGYIIVGESADNWAAQSISK
jgi:hypothetical protein